MVPLRPTRVQAGSLERTKVLRSENGNHVGVKALWEDTKAFTGQPRKTNLPSRSSSQMGMSNSPPERCLSGISLGYSNQLSWLLF